MQILIEQLVLLTFIAAFVVFGWGLFRVVFWFSDRLEAGNRHRFDQAQRVAHAQLRARTIQRRAQRTAVERDWREDCQ